jgi:uncharacterized protein (DUF169 family)
MDWSEAAVQLERYVRPATFPLALKMLHRGEALPERARRPLQDLGVHMATCQVWNTSRRYGWTMAAQLHDLSCPPGIATLGFEPLIPYYEEGRACEGMYTATAEAGARTEAATARFDYQEYETFVSAPLARARFDPDLILIYGNPAQVMRLVTGTLWHSGGRIQSSFSGRLVCADIIPATMQSGQPQVILPCSGDRIFGQTHDHEMAFAFPVDQLPTILEGLEGTHRGGIRYPIPNFMRYTGKYPPQYERLMELWREQEE